MTQQTNGMPELKYSEETFRDMYEALKELVASEKHRTTFRAEQALAKAEGVN